MKLTRVVLRAIAALLLAAQAHAGSVIEVMHPWARPTVPNRPSALYFGVHNLGDAPDRLVGARAEGVGRIELHKSEEKDGVMTMFMVEGIDIPAGGMADLDPGGFHFMLFDIAKPLKEGDTLDVTLVFESAGDVEVQVPVSRKLGAAAQGEMESGMTHSHGMGGSGQGTTGN